MLSRPDSAIVYPYNSAIGDLFQAVRRKVDDRIALIRRFEDAFENVRLLPQFCFRPLTLGDVPSVHVDVTRLLKSGRAGWKTTDHPSRDPGIVFSPE